MGAQTTSHLIRAVPHDGHVIETLLVLGASDRHQRHERSVPGSRSRFEITPVSLRFCHDHPRGFPATNDVPLTVYSTAMSRW